VLSFPPTFMMIAFLDTEFTDLVTQPRLLSVGLVAGNPGGADFYAEVTDTDRIHASSWFALSAVLPQFGKVPAAACTYAALGGRLAKFLADLTDALVNDVRLPPTAERVRQAILDKSRKATRDEPSTSALAT
jgi:hypothetical protein